MLIYDKGICDFSRHAQFLFMQRSGKMNIHTNTTCVPSNKILSHFYKLTSEKKKKDSHSLVNKAGISKFLTMM